MLHIGLVLTDGASGVKAGGGMLFIGLLAGICAWRVQAVGSRRAPLDVTQRENLSVSSRYLVNGALACAIVGVLVLIISA
jgi:hypothetical protein